MTLRRKAHVYRVYQTDEEGKIVDVDVWVDVMRLDLISVTQYGNTDVDGQVINYYTDWRNDTPTSVEERVYERIELKNPDDDTVSIFFPIVHRTRFVFPSNQKGTSYQALKWSFKNDRHGEDVSKRKFKTIRVYNNDLKDEIDWPEVKVGDPQPASEIRGTGLGKIIYPVTWDTYAAALQDGKQDENQHIDVEVVTDFKMKFPNWSDAGGSGSGQTVLFHLKQDSIDPPVGVLTLFDTPPDDKYVIYRLDPLQIIVNVSWGEGLAVEFNNGAS